ncbi:hypothetical protein [Vibrio metschnikovii]|uniref:hypothetical protein n=1 Tax=Vibrio metschnikovii TaxID=28172 RepID=UPI001C2F2FFF|nr:hypothetical protein [Vibrio metschnikovii]
MQKTKTIKQTTWYMGQYLDQPEAFQVMLDDFEDTIRQYGLWGGKLDGAVRDSSRVDPKSPYYQETVDLCNDFRLFHYHIGWESYTGRDIDNKLTSNWVVHIHVETPHEYHLVGLGEHSPMHLPEQIKKPDSFPE